MKKTILFILIICSAFNLNAQKQGQAKIDSLLILLKTDKIDTSRINHLNLMAQEFAQIKPDTALLLCQQALVLSNKIKWETGIGYSYHIMGYIYYNLSDQKQALQFYNKAMSIWDKLLLKNNNIIVREPNLERTIKKRNHLP